MQEKDQREMKRDDECMIRLQRTKATKDERNQGKRMMKGAQSVSMQASMQLSMRPEIWQRLCNIKHLEKSLRI